MKSVIMENYIIGLASFLDENNIKWERLSGDTIKIYYTDEEMLFRVGFDFGKFYSKTEDND